MESVFARIAATIVTLIALAAGAILGHSLYGQSRVSGMTTDIEFIINNARGQFAQSANGYANFTTDNVGSLQTAGVLPTDMIRNGSLYDAWGNTVSIDSTSGGGQAQIVFGGGNGETTDQCTQLVTALHDYVSLSVGDSQAFTPTNVPDAVSGAQACTGGNAQITLTFQ